MVKYLGLILGASFAALVSYNVIRWRFPVVSSKTNLEVVFTSIPSVVKPSQKFMVAWAVHSPTDTQTKYTTVFYGLVSTPSALSQSVLPQEVIYPNKVPDYIGDYFNVPSDFSAEIIAPDKGKLYLRGYAYVDGRAMWTDEKTVTVKP